MPYKSDSVATVSQAGGTERSKCAPQAVTGGHNTVARVLGYRLFYSGQDPRSGL